MKTFQKLFKSTNGGHFNYSSMMTGCNKVRKRACWSSASAKAQWVARGTGAPSPVMWTAGSAADRGNSLERIEPTKPTKHMDKFTLTINLDRISRRSHLEE